MILDMEANLLGATQGHVGALGAIFCVLHSKNVNILFSKCLGLAGAPTTSCLEAPHAPFPLKLSCGVLEFCWWDCRCVALQVIYWLGPEPWSNFPAKCMSCCGSSHVYFCAKHHMVTVNGRSLCGPAHSGWSLPESEAPGDANLQSGRTGFLPDLGLLGPRLISTVGEKDTLSILVVTVKMHVKHSSKCFMYNINPMENLLLSAVYRKGNGGKENLPMSTVARCGS